MRTVSAYAVLLSAVGGLALACAHTRSGAAGGAQGRPAEGAVHPVASNVDERSGRSAECPAAHLPMRDGQWLWAKRLSVSGNAYPSDFALLPDGSFYLTGTCGYDPAVDFGVSRFRCTSEYDGFLARYDSAGNTLWVQRTQNGNALSGAGNVVVLADGSALLTGYFIDRIQLGTIELKADNPETPVLYLARYTTDGQVQWARPIANTDTLEGYALARHSDEAVYAVGQYHEGTWEGQRLSVPEDAGTQCLVVKYTGAGQKLWAKTLRTEGDCSIYLVAAAPDGSVYVAGTYSKAGLDFGTAQLSVPGAMFLARYSASGEVLWARRSLGPAHDSPAGLAVGSDGVAYLIGIISGEGFAELPQRHTHREGEAFIAQFGPEGRLRWIHRAAETGMDSVAVLADGSVAVGGFYYSDVQFGRTRLTRPKGGYLGRYDACGQSLGAVGFKTPDVQYVQVAAHPQGGALMTGVFGTQIDLGNTKQIQIGNTTLTSTAKWEGFVARWQ